MSGFIKKAACSGRRPSQFAGYNGYQRADLVARLLKERSIARFVVAPAGYGKTYLLVEYAETMFAWAHVFWVNCQSPCFLRDLDEGTIASDCRLCDKEARLVVFDDVPLLDAARAQSFSQQIDALLSAKCEVMVTCTPRCDVFGQLQRDRVRVGASELLLSDEELNTVRSIEERTQAPSSSLGEARRVAALVWRESPDAAVSFLKSGFKEHMPSDLLLAMSSMFVMQRGSLADLANLGPLDLELVEELALEYPHLGFDSDTKRFETPRFSADDLATAFKGILESVTQRSAFDSREELVWAWADLLIDAEGLDRRACDIVRALCPRTKRARWLASRAVELMGDCCLYKGLLLARAVRTTAGEGIAGDKAMCLAFESLCSGLLGEKDDAVRLAKRVAFEDAAAESARTCCLIAAAHYGNDTLRSRAEEALEQIARVTEDARPQELSPWAQLARSWGLALQPEELMEWWCALEKADAEPMVLNLSASWIFSAMAQRAAASPSEERHILSANTRRVVAYVRFSLLADNGEEPDFFAVSAGLSYEEARMKGALVGAEVLPTRAMTALRRCEMSLMSQKAELERDREVARSVENALPAMGSADQLSAVLPLGTVPVRSVPILKLRMFGRFEASIGGIAVDERGFRRKHVRMLLLLLAVNLGRDMSRDTLCKELWPDSPLDLARRNFYTVWSKLRKALSLSDGSCPYLVKHRFGCGLREQYVQCDLLRFNEICRELMFGKPDAKGWSALYAEIDENFANELLPSEQGGELLDKVRADCKSRLVDALVSATQGLIDGGNAQLAVWFAHSAVEHDELREDAYVALMRAQIANSKRTAAMMTYHKCRKALADQLGVDPSPETTALYQELLDSL